MENKIFGISTSNGIAIAQIHHLNELPLIQVGKLGKGYDIEVKRLEAALLTAKKELTSLYQDIEKSVGKDQASIFNAQSLMLDDPMLKEETLKKIKEDSTSAEYAFRQTISEMIDLFEASENMYIKERVADLKDIMRRVLAHLTGMKSSKHLINKDVILVADEIMPSLTATLDKKYIKAIVTLSGSKTSHAAILARHLGIPAISGIDVSKLPENQLAIVDGKKGFIILDPSEEEVQLFKDKQKQIIKEQQVYLKLKNQNGKTKDGKEIGILANISEPIDIENAKEQGAMGVGLLRTENQYMESSDFPTEDELTNFYLEVASNFKDQKVVARTLDIGGDKELPYLSNRGELNPFLGNRAIRYSLSYPSLFRTQLRALLKSNKHKNLSIMLPMVTVKEELDEAKKVIDTAISSLKEEFVDVNLPKFGIMIEVPLAALHIETLIKYVDFVSIGTNDLIQYLFATDRTNEKVANLYQPYHPVVLRTIKNIVDVAHKAGKKVSVCGEMASNPKQSLLLVGLGVDDLSMNANSIAEIKYLISKADNKKLQSIVSEALTLETNKEVSELIEQYYKELAD